MTTTTYAADRSALLIVDPYNDFMSQGGKLYEATRETAEAVGFYDHMRQLIPAIRAARIQVTIMKDATAAFDQDGMHAAHEVDGPRFAHALLTTQELLARLPARNRERSGNERTR